MISANSPYDRYRYGNDKDVEQLRYANFPRYCYRSSVSCRCGFARLLG
ncbi:hypothetical protein [Tolypothrix sp. NIES-4075]|nr:hypothetical protein [Tolypothrix sp. NIES-4075]